MDLAAVPETERLDERPEGGVELLRCDRGEAGVDEDGLQVALEEIGRGLEVEAARRRVAAATMSPSVASATAS